MLRDASVFVCLLLRAMLALRAMRMMRLNL
jgi:hypothetical protein